MKHLFAVSAFFFTADNFLVVTHGSQEEVIRAKALLSLPTPIVSMFIAAPEPSIPAAASA
jgi:hypothetical protein